MPTTLARPTRSDADVIWLTTAQAAAHCDRGRRALTGGRARVTASTVRQWVVRKHLAPARVELDGKHLYRLDDIARAELATRERAFRLIGIGRG